MPVASQNIVVLLSLSRKLDNRMRSSNFYFYQNTQNTRHFSVPNIIFIMIYRFSFYRFIDNEIEEKRSCSPSSSVFFLFHRFHLSQNWLLFSSLQSLFTLTFNDL